MGGWPRGSEGARDITDGRPSRTPPPRGRGRRVDDAGVRMYSCRIGVQNLGSGGWSKQGAAIPSLMSSNRVALLGLTEVHQPEGSTYEEFDGCTVIPSGKLGGVKGGSALVVDGRDGARGSGVEHVERVDCYCTNNCVWYKVSLAGAVVLYLCVLYMPPWTSGGVCCEPLCENDECTGVHDESVLTHVRASADVFAATGAAVCIIGDLNGSPPAEEVITRGEWDYHPSSGSSKRWTTISRTLLAAVDVGDGSGEELPGLVTLGSVYGWVATRRPYPLRAESHLHDDEFGAALTESILDHAFVTCDTLELISSFEVLDEGVSDHSMLVVTFEWSAAQAAHAFDSDGDVPLADGDLVMPISDLPVELRRVYLKYDDALNQADVAWRWDAYRAVMEAWCRDRLDRLDGTDGRSEALPSLRDMLHTSIGALAQSGLSARRVVKVKSQHASGGHGRDSDWIEAALLKHYGELARTDPETAAMLAEVRAMTERRRKAARTRRDAQVKLRRLPSLNRVAIGLQRRRMELAQSELTVTHTFFKRLTRLRRQASRRHAANVVHTAIAGGNHVVVARMVSALGKTVALWRRRKKRSTVPREQLGVWHDEFVRTYVSKPAMVLDDAVATSAGDASAAAGLPSGNPEWDALLNGDVTPDEVRRAMHRLKGTSAATGVPNRVVKAAVASGAQVELYARIFTSYLRDPTTMPVELSGVVACPVLKPQQTPGVPDNYRKLAVGWSDSRLFQCIFAHRLLLYFQRTNVLDPAQHGFLYGCSVEQAVWLSHALSDPAFQTANAGLYHVLLDIKTAFASAQHASILTGLARLGVVGRLWALLRVFLSNANVTMLGGDAALRPISVKVGLCEGWVLSPVLFNVLLDGLLVRLSQHAALTPSAYPAAEGHVFSNISFADDMDLLALSAEAAQSSLDVAVAWIDEHGMALNLNKGKSEVVLIGPKSRRTTALSIAEEDLRFVDEYKLLGRMIAAAGPAQAYRLMLDKCTASTRAAVARASASGLRDAGIAEGRVFILTRIRVGATYAVGVWGVDAPEWRRHALDDTMLHKLDRRVCATVLQMERAQWPAVQCLLGVVALPTVYIKSVLRILFDGLSHPRDHHLRQALKRSVQTKDAWWTRTRKILQELDWVESTEGTSVYKQTGVMWLNSVVVLINEREPDMKSERATLQTLRSHVNLVVEWLDWSLRKLVVQGMRSLTATADLLDDESATLGMLPFLRGERSKADRYRCHLRGGTYYLFSYLHWEKKCPLCDSATITVPHLLMECPSLSDRRLTLQTELRRIAFVGDSGCSLMATDEPLQDPAAVLPWTPEQRAIAVRWYHFIVGAPVPASFFHSSIFTVRDKSGLPRKEWVERDVHLRVYRRMLVESGFFIKRVFKAVALKFGVKKHIHGTNLVLD